MSVVQEKTDNIQVGQCHGSAARNEIARSVAFYKDIFITSSGRTWEQVLETSKEFAVTLENKLPRYFQELQGIFEKAQTYNS